MTDQKPISRGEAVKQVIAQLDGPISMDEFVQRVLAIWPSSAKNPRSSITTHLRWEETGKSLVFLDRQTVAPLRLTMQGVRFRVPVTGQEAKRGVLAIEPYFRHFLRRDIAHQNVQLLDAARQPLPVRVVTLKQDAKGFLGSFTLETPVFDLSDWFRGNRVRNGDSILVTVEDWQTGRFRLEHEPARQRRQPEIRRKNQELADLIFEMLEAARDEYVYADAAVTSAYARMSDPRGYPGDHWMEVLAQDSRMRTDGIDIRYAESRSPLERWLGDAAAPPEAHFSPAQGRRVYRFKAAFAHRPGLWRRIEIQGKQTLAEFDAVLRAEFQHDFSDHLSGFWKRIRRATGRRYREVDLGDINPFGGGRGADLRVAGLGLNPGDELKYVYDFGDWIEHLITLEEIVEPEKGAKYPRTVDRNKPRYAYCEHCRAEGRKTVATWICIDCSNEERRQVLVCEDCLMAWHEDHYAEEVVY
jgi:hypothetical protein